MAPGWLLVGEPGAGNLVMVLRLPAASGGPFVLKGAGFQVNIRRPARPNRSGSRRRAESGLADAMRSYVVGSSSTREE